MAVMLRSRGVQRCHIVVAKTVAVLFINNMHNMFWAPFHRTFKVLRLILANVNDNIGRYNRFVDIQCLSITSTSR